MRPEPDNRDEIVLLPEASLITNGELRPAIAEIRSQSLDDLRDAMNDEANWESLFARFDCEKALSGYIAEATRPCDGDKLRRDGPAAAR